MSIAVFKGNASGTGTVTVETPNTNSDFTIALPSRACTLASDGPAFSAYRNGTQTISGDTWTKVEFNAESFDTANCFDSTTNYRFTPNVAGYYHFIGVVQSSNTTAYLGSAIYKNGAPNALTWSNNESAMTAVSTAIFYMNGSTDYVEVYSLITGGTTKTIAQGLANTYFHGVLVRGA